MIVAMLLAAAQPLPSTPDLGKVAGRCRSGEQGPSVRVEVAGLKDRSGRLKLELYPANDQDFLADDNVLVAAGKPFARVEVPVPPTGPVTLCIRAPSPGLFALSLLHDRDGDGKFALSVDGVGFPGDPKLGWSKPPARAASILVGTGPADVRIVLNYRRGLLSFGPIGS